MSGDRQEIERIKAEMRRARRMTEQMRMVQAWLGSPEDRAQAAAELDEERPDVASDDIRSIDSEPDLPNVTDDRISFEELEAERLERAQAGLPHGYDHLARACLTSKSTVQRRYKGRQPPGSEIAGVCDQAPKHQHLS